MKTAVHAIEVIGVSTIPEIAPGVDLPVLLADAIRASGQSLEDGDVLVIAQKIVSKAEGAIVHAADVVPSADSLELAKRLGKDPVKVEVIMRETARIVAAEWPEGKAEGVLICEHRLGFISANAGVDESNTGEPGRFILLPKDPDRSADRIREEMEREFGAAIGVVITDSFGRPWRLGIVNIAIGVSGISALIDLRGETDSDGRVLSATTIAVADELAAAAGLAMGKLNAVPAVIIRGFRAQGNGSAKDLIRKKEEDIFK